MASSYAPLQFLRSPWNNDVWTAIDNQIDNRTTFVLYLGEASSLPEDRDKYQIGCVLIHKAEKEIYLNVGNDSVPDWQSFGPGSSILPEPFVPGQVLTNDGIEAFWSLVNLQTMVTGELQSINIDLDDLIGNTYFTENLANNSNFINQLTSNITFQNAVKVFVSGTGQTQIDQTPDNGTYGLLAGDVDGVNDTFTVSLDIYASGTLQVYLNGLLQQQGASEDFVELDAEEGTFTFNTPPAIGDVITVVYSKEVTSINEYKVGATIDDTTPKYLDDKIEITSDDDSVTVTKTIENPAGDEKIVYDLSVNTSGSGIISLTAGEDLTAGDTVGYASFIDDTAMKSILPTKYTSTTVGFTNEGVHSVCRVSDDKYAIAFLTNSLNIRIVIGTLDRDTNTWTFGSSIGSGGSSWNGGNISLVKLDEDKFAMCFFKETTNPYKLVVATYTVSGMVVTYENETIFTEPSTDNANNVQAVQLDTDRFALVVGGQPAGSHCDLFEVTVSGTVPTIGTQQVLTSSVQANSAIVKIGTDKVAIINNTKLWIATVSAGVWTIGTPVTFTTGTGSGISGEQLSGLSMVSNATDTFYISRGVQTSWRVTYFTVSGTTPTQVADTVYSLGSGTQSYVILATDNTNVYALMNGASVKGIAKLNVNGSSVVFSYIPSIEIPNQITTRLMAANQILNGSDYFGFIGNVDGGVSNFQFDYYVQGMTPYFIGIAQNTVSRGGSVQVKIAGVDENQTGLAAGALYNPLQGGITPATTQGVTTMIAQSATKLKI